MGHSSAGPLPSKIGPRFARIISMTTTRRGDSHRRRPADISKPAASAACSSRWPPRAPPTTTAARTSPCSTCGRMTPEFDYFVLVTGNSRRQLHAISDEIDRTLEDELGDQRHGHRRLQRKPLDPARLRLGRDPPVRRRDAGVLRAGRSLGRQPSACRCRGKQSQTESEMTRSRDDVGGRVSSISHS